MSGRAGKTTLVYFGSQIAMSLAGFLTTWIIANQLGGAILGEYSVVVAVLFWMNVPSSAIGSSLNKRISEEDETNAYFSAGCLIVAATTVGLTVIIILGQDIINDIFNHDISTVFVLLVASNALFDIVLDSLRGTKQVGRSGLLKTFEQIIRSGFQITVVLTSAGFVWLVAGHAAALFLASAIGVLLLRTRPTVPTRRHFSRLFEFARYSWLGTVKVRAFGWMDTMVMGLFAGFTALGFAGVTHFQIGVYAAAWSLASVLGLLSISIKQTLFPELSDLSADGNYERVRHFINEGLAFAGLFVIPGLFGTMVIGDAVLRIYRSNFAVGHWILVILVVARLLSAYGSQLLGAINAVDRPDIAFRINLAFLLVNFVGNVVLVAFFGWYGAAIATALSGALSFGASLFGLSRIIGSIAIPYREIGYQFVAATVMSAVVYLIDTQITLSRIETIATVGIAAIVYIIIILSLSTRFRQKVWSISPILKI